MRVLVAHGEQLNTPEASLTISYKYSPLTRRTVPYASILSGKQQKGSPKLTNRSKNSIPNLTHEEALMKVVNILKEDCNIQKVRGVGHRIVHGGESCTDSIIVDDSVLLEIELNSRLAPLHNPANIQGIRLCQKILNKPNVAVFDTAFHSEIPAYASTYPIPLAYRDELGIKRYGFHGTSVQYVTMKTNQILDQISRADDENVRRFVIAHVGNGASVTAVVANKSVDTTMGFTPLEGLMMGTRSGSIDPSIVSYLSKAKNLSSEEVLQILNKKSGLYGISGSIDMRTILSNMQKGDKHAVLAVDMFVYILAKHIASMCVACRGSIDAIVFTAGIGEHSSEIRSLTIHQLSSLLRVSHSNVKSGSIGFPLIMVVPTDEEFMISMECRRLLSL